MDEQEREIKYWLSTLVLILETLECIKEFEEERLAVNCLDVPGVIL